MKRLPISEDAIFAAHAGAENMDNEGYTYKNNPYIVGTATVISPTGKRYRTHAHRGIIRTERGQYVDSPNFCNCPFCLEEGICEHIIWLGDKLDEEAYYSRQAEAMEDADPHFNVDKYGLPGRFDG